MDQHIGDIRIPQTRNIRWNCWRRTIIKRLMRTAVSEQVRIPEPVFSQSASHASIRDHFRHYQRTSGTVWAIHNLTKLLHSEFIAHPTLRASRKALGDAAANGYYHLVQKNRFLPSVVELAKLLSLDDYGMDGRLDAFKLFKYAASRGDSGAMTWYAILLDRHLFELNETSQSESPQFAEVVGYLADAISLGNAVAKSCLGDIYMVGRPGIPRNEVVGLFWHRAATESGNLHSAYIALPLLEERVPADAADALNKFMQQCNYVDEINNLANAYLYGIGRFSVNLEAAKRLFRCSLRKDRNNIGAQLGLLVVNDHVRRSNGVT